MVKNRFITGAVKSPLHEAFSRHASYPGCAALPHINILQKLIHYFQSGFEPAIQEPKSAIVATNQWLLPKMFW